MSNWQPIETAPKDGTRIDLWSPIAKCRIGGAFWHEGDLGPRWYTKQYCGDYLENVAVATRVSHWMPYPEPPAQTKDPGRLVPPHGSGP